MTVDQQVDRDPDPRWQQVSELIAERTGLHFPRERLRDLQRGLAGAANELGFKDATACADGLLSERLSKAQLQVVAGHLTVGETYFLREEKTFDALASHILPELIGARRHREQRLRIWTAGCCTGEEAYSLAILLHQLLPDLADWQVTILATDINPGFLRKAIAGSYGEWSFRAAPAEFKERYFERTADRRYIIRPEIKRLVVFEQLNLVEDGYPSLATDTNAMDLIFCRNVLMYFTPAQARKVIGKLHHALIEGGWLAVSPSEASQALLAPFVARTFPGVILYQKNDAHLSASLDQAAARVSASPEIVAPVAPFGWAEPEPDARLPERPSPSLERQLPSPPERPSAVDAPDIVARAVSLYEEGRYSEAVDTLLVAFGKQMPPHSASSLLARALANQGKLTEAAAWCDRWIAADKLDVTGHYLHGVVLMEQGHTADARQALQRALYLKPGFVLGHFALGSLARSQGNADEAARHFANALRLLQRLQPDDLLPESDGLTGQRLTETIRALTTQKSAR